MQAARLILRAAKIDEADQLLAFYENNPDRFLLPRPFSEFKTAIDRGQFFVVTDGEDIIAASGVFDYSEDEPFVELAETFVATEFRGFGLQSVFFKVRIASVIAFQGPSVGISTAVDGRNNHSLKTKDREGFEPWASPIESAYSSCPGCPNKSPERACCCDFYLLPPDRARLAIGNLLDETASGLITLKNRSEDMIEVQCECLVLTSDELRKVLRGFVEGETW